MKMQIPDYCSQIQIERYLLNKMSPDEETLFQEHLETCKACRTYINSIRNLSSLIADEEPIYARTPVKKKLWKVQKQQLWSYISIAACIVFVVVTSLYIFNVRDGGSGITMQKTYIDNLSKADMAEITIEMLFPDKEEVSVLAGTPIVFKWNREATYKLVIVHDNQTIYKAEGFGECCIPLLKTEDSTTWDWILNIEASEFNGTIHFIN